MMKSYFFEHPSRGISNHIVADRKADYLLPPSVDEWLNQDHMARCIFAVIDQLDLSGRRRGSRRALGLSFCP